MGDGCDQKAMSNVSRRAFISSGALAILSPRLGIASDDQTQSDPLPSWKDGPAKAAILAFVSEHHRKIQPQVC